MLGREAAMNPFGRAARAFTPVGAGITAIGLGKDYYDFVQSRILSPEERVDPEEYAAEQEEQMGMSNDRQKVRTTTKIRANTTGVEY